MRGVLVTLRCCEALSSPGMVIAIESRQMTRLETVVVGTDFSTCAESALVAVRDFAPSWQVKRIHLVSVVEPVAWASASLVSAGADLAAIALEGARRRLEAIELNVPGAETSYEVRLGSPARELALAADEQNADGIITATHGHTGLQRMALGSVSSDLVRISRVPVLIIPSRTSLPSGLSRVLAAIDLSPISAEVLRSAGWVAKTTPGGEVRVLSLFEYPLLESPPDEVLPHFPSKEELEELENDYRQRVERVVRESGMSVPPAEIDVLSKAPTAQVILDVASLTQTNLIVLGTSGRNAWHRMIVGSTATRVLSEAPCPVLVVPHAIKEVASDASGNEGVGAASSAT